MSEENLENMVEKDDEKFDYSYLKYWIPLVGLMADFEDHGLSRMSCHEKGANARQVFQLASFIATGYGIYRLIEHYI